MKAGDLVHTFLPGALTVRTEKPIVGRISHVGSRWATIKPLPHGDAVAVKVVNLLRGGFETARQGLHLDPRPLDSRLYAPGKRILVHATVQKVWPDATPPMITLQPVALEDVVEEAQPVPADGALRVAVKNLLDQVQPGAYGGVFAKAETHYGLHESVADAITRLEAAFNAAPSEA